MQIRNLVSHHVLALLGLAVSSAAGTAFTPVAAAESAPGKVPRTAVLQPQEPIVLRGRKDHVIQGVRIVPGDGKAAAGIALYDCENVTINCCEIGPVEKNEWDAWKYFKANGLPKPPSARPTPPVLYGDALVPWKTEAKKPSW